MRYSPHEYQRFVIDYIKKNPIAAVFLDMGLGKTSITLTALNDLLLDSFDVHRVLVVAPLRVARNTWSSEIRKWEHLQDLQYSIVVGTEKERMSALEKRADIYIINRENVHDWTIHFVRSEKVSSVSTNKSSKSFSHIKQLELCK